MKQQSNVSLQRPQIPPKPLLSSPNPGVRFAPTRNLYDGFNPVKSKRFDTTASAAIIAQKLGFDDNERCLGDLSTDITLLGAKMDSLTRN